MLPVPFPLSVREIGFQEEVISSSKEVQCPNGGVPNEVYVRNKSSSGKKTRGMANNKTAEWLRCESLRSSNLPALPAGKTTFPKLSAILQSAPVPHTSSHVLPPKRLSQPKRFLSANHPPLSSATFPRVCLFVKHKAGWRPV